MASGRPGFLDSRWDDVADNLVESLTFGFFSFSGSGKKGSFARFLKHGYFNIPGTSADYQLILCPNIKASWIWFQAAIDCLPPIVVCRLCQSASCIPNNNFAIAQDVSNYT